jgi:hypothetical protein
MKVNLADESFWFSYSACWFKLIVLENMLFPILRTEYNKSNIRIQSIRHGCCLRGDKGREKETEWMATIVWRLAKKFGGIK